MPSVDYRSLNPLSHDYYFSAATMGLQTSTEIQNLALRKTPFYFRGSKNAPHIRDLLDVQFQPGKYFRDLVRHLRVYARCETFMFEAKYFAPGMGTIITANSSQYDSLDESSTMAMYLGRLGGLRHSSTHVLLLCWRCVSLPSKGCHSNRLSNAVCTRWWNGYTVMRRIVAQM